MSRKGGPSSHTWKPFAEVFDCRCLFLLSNLLVLLLVGSSLEALPWQSTPEEVHEDMTQSLKIVTP